MNGAVIPGTVTGMGQSAMRRNMAERRSFRKVLISKELACVSVFSAGGYRMA
jgi:hypothetical protein